MKGELAKSENVDEWRGKKESYAVGISTPPGGG